MSTRRVLFAVGVLLAACEPAPAPVGNAIAVADALGGDAAAAAGFARATTVPVLEFPRDHGAHSAYRTEWWYVTGNVATHDGRRFGVQLVFFRQALQPPSTTPRTASLAAEQVVLAHAAVTDIDGQRFFHEERSARLAAGLATVAEASAVFAEQPFAVRCAGWSAESQRGGDGFLPLQLNAAGAEFAFTLLVEAGKPLVLQGDHGLSQKSAERGNASIYYSLTRCPLAGRITVAGVAHEVQGDGWIDREWSTSALGAEQVGWDWFSLQLDDGHDVMWYRLRRRDGSVDPLSRGCVVDREGHLQPLRVGQVTATSTGTWRARDGAAAYPAQWRLRASGDEPFDLTIEPAVPDQELRVLVRYWEGAVVVRGTHLGVPVAGRGYLEMTGYTTR